jgi:hypothetical protein
MSGETIAFFIPSSEGTKPTSPQDVLNTHESAKNVNASGSYGDYHGDLTTAGPVYRRTVKFAPGQPVETVVMKLNVRYPRHNKNNSNPFKDSSY